MNSKQIRTDPKYEGMTKKKIKKELRKNNIVTKDKQALLDVKKAKQNRLALQKLFKKSLKTNLITDGLIYIEANEFPNEHGEDDKRNKTRISRKVPNRQDMAHVLQNAPTVIIDLDFSKFEDKKVT